VFLQKTYSTLLGLYPVDFQIQFGDEMAAVFQQAAAEHRRRGRLDLALFALREMLGLTAGAVRARVSDPSPAVEDLPFPSDIGAAEKYVALVSRRLIEAISTHDFPKARLYDVQDRRARALLARLRAQPD